MREAVARHHTSPRATEGFPLLKKPRSARERLRDPRHLLLAWQAISKRRPESRGLDQITIDEFRNNLHRNIGTISEQLRDGSFSFTLARGVLIPKAGSNKKRPIKVPAVRDRVVLKAIALLIRPKFAKYDLDCSFGYVRKRGVRDAVDRVSKLAAQGKKIVLEADIHSFFDEVDQDLLIDQFVREIRLRSLTALVRDALKVEVGNLDQFSDEDKKCFPTAESGIPQGGVLSPMLANFYLHRFDKAMMRAGHNLVRYADDFVVMCGSREEAESAYALSKRILEGQLHLHLHELGAPGSKTRLIEFDKGLKFLGIHFAGGRTVPCDAVITKFKDRLHTILDVRQGNSLLDTLTTLRNTVVGWGQCYRDLDVHTLYLRLDEYIRSEVSLYLQEHRLLQQGHIVSLKQLRFLGVPQLRDFKKVQASEPSPSRSAKVTATKIGASAGPGLERGTQMGF